MQPIVLPDLKAMALDPDLAWEPFRLGVEIHRLYPAEPDGAAAALLRYQPGASVPHHRHTGFEHILVLSGSQTDDNGTYPASTLVVNLPGTHHTVSSTDGCIVLAIWAKPVHIEE
ncbi:cupin domain-containing protein [Leptolyngbya sp. CCNP1308]|uniref:cupin domain-containing protein n=1 Tax=Leptolyngbya sp. CCNP1308 TaxID=3110255 RepID=UPI002B203DDA|nr:cupin domain-containing protein [Leptolyngbya sp. CCNP1308]MEA5450827.1 cupin domain-containing protein [Leptolyngbya sp. CCNP1308]